MCTVLTGVAGFVLGNLSGVILGICLVYMSMKLHKWRNSKSKLASHSAINMDVQNMPSIGNQDSIVYEDINNSIIAKPSEDVQLQQNTAYGRITM